MDDSKIEIKLGLIEFRGEGEKKWLSEQLDKIIEKAPELIKLSSKLQLLTEKTVTSSVTDEAHNEDVANKPLATFLKSKNATSNQVLKFLVTSIWLHAKGNKRLATKEVTKALRDSSQTKLGNASDCLQKNITKGNCEKDGSHFFVTEEGMDSV